MLRVECDRTLFTRPHVPLRTMQYVSPAAMTYPKNKKWNLKGNSIAAARNRTGFERRRIMACVSKPRPECTEVDIDVLKWKNVFLFFSGLDISDGDISILRRLHDEGMKRQQMYKVVWIPVVEQWTPQLHKDFENLRSEMPWYTAQCLLPILGIKEKWHFKGKPILAVMNSQGEVKNTNALPSIRNDGMKDFPFHEELKKRKSYLRQFFES
ncbi:protein SIEVE ELEMENT OCCLUSION B-like [Prunus yedoensis var. nudiflora]|uniref:Protein SIEVE ELEMENT OCCLUSION B-like n=1 Tax=Prunus yedoensis var. nudiflora TaxID=2094558 RepID=A0A314ZQR7_PRUYE|nr:protein SIEVE ELEMENT OCCLUSION B-like [Prunus yedoensis var. nudiflora]PQQ20703.1 protein SIEVE ELEMENT OCCLUSION B-like [Prunus yedoensis var. nudiflora]